MPIIGWPMLYFTKKLLKVAFNELTFEAEKSFGIQKAYFSGKKYTSPERRHKNTPVKEENRKIKDLNL